MIALIQRVTDASVAIAGETVGRIGPGMLVLVGVGPGDTPETLPRALEKLLTYRIFADEGGKMNLNLRQIGGGLLLVPQFTLLADTAKGTRPGFSNAAPPELARQRFGALVALAQAAHPQVAAGRFGADMQVSLVNDGPVTFWLEVH
jgi:D-tyrosyl-tRNA(Tyr) deacylase